MVLTQHIPWSATQVGKETHIGLTYYRHPSSRRRRHSRRSPHSYLCAPSSGARTTRSSTPGPRVSAPRCAGTPRRWSAAPGRRSRPSPSRADSPPRASSFSWRPCARRAAAFLPLQPRGTRPPQLQPSLPVCCGRVAAVVLLVLLVVVLVVPRDGEVFPRRLAHCLCFRWWMLCW